VSILASVSLIVHDKQGISDLQIFASGLQLQPYYNLKIRRFPHRPVHGNAVLLLHPVLSWTKLKKMKT